VSGPILTELTRGLARRLRAQRRLAARATDVRDQVRREARLTLSAVADALGERRPVNLLDLAALRERALRLRADNVALSAELRRCRDTLADALGELGDDHARAYGWLTTPIDGSDDGEHLDAKALASEVTDLRDRLAETRELNRGWARYGQRVRERRRTHREWVTRATTDLSHLADLPGVPPRVATGIKLAVATLRAGEDA